MKIDITLIVLALLILSVVLPRKLRKYKNICSDSNLDCLSNSSCYFVYRQILNMTQEEFEEIKKKHTLENVSGYYLLYSTSYYTFINWIQISDLSDRIRSDIQSENGEEKKFILEKLDFFVHILNTIKNNLVDETKEVLYRGMNYPKVIHKNDVVYSPFFQSYSFTLNIAMNFLQSSLNSKETSPTLLVIEKNSNPTIGRNIFERNESNYLNEEEFLVASQFFKVVDVEEIKHICTWSGTCTYRKITLKKIKEPTHITDIDCL